MLKKKIKYHIASFPTKVSHYSRRDSLNLWLNPGINLTKIYRLFKEKYPDILANLTLYSKIFKRDFNLHFGTIQSDTCKESDKNWAQLIVAGNEEERKKIEQESSVHNITADKAYKTLSVNSANANYITLCIYLQQVLFTPKLTHPDVYYQWQNSLCNLCVHNMTDDQANMFFWHGSLAKSGLKLIGSCLLKYIISTYNPLILGKREC